MERFANNWATREFIKGICQNARRHCRKKGIKDPTLPPELLESNGSGDADAGDDGNKDANDNAGDENDNGDDNDNGDGDGNDNGDEDENDNSGKGNEDDDVDEGNNPSDAEASDEEENRAHARSTEPSIFPLNSPALTEGFSFLSSEGMSSKAGSAVAKAKVSILKKSTNPRRPPMAASESDSEDASMNSPSNDEGQDFDNPGDDIDGSEDEE